VRVASANKSGELHFVIDGRSYPEMKVADTGGHQTWATIESAKTFAFPRGSIHTVRLFCDSGGVNINYWQYHDELPLGRTIRLLAETNDKWITAGSNALPVNGNKAGAAQRFKVIDQSGSYWYGVVALQSVDNHIYVTAEPTGVLSLAGKASIVAPNELFQWTDNGDGTISLRSLVNYLAVSAVASGDLTEPALVDNTVTLDANESFAIR